MKVKEFIEWLKTQNQEATVEVLVHSSGRGYYDQGGTVSTEEFTSDLAYSTYSPEYGKHFESGTYNGEDYLLIGSKEN